jgi:hypothetical protein
MDPNYAVPTSSDQLKKEQVENFYMCYVPGCGKIYRRPKK